MQSVQSQGDRGECSVDGCRRQLTAGGVCFPITGVATGTVATGFLAAAAATAAAVIAAVIPCDNEK